METFCKLRCVVLMMRYRISAYIINVFRTVWELRAPENVELLKKTKNRRFSPINVHHRLEPIYRVTRAYNSVNLKVLVVASDWKYLK